MSLVEAFDANLPGWKEWQTAPWGRLYYSVAHSNLRRHLPAGPLKILDVAGGNGLDAVQLAGQGHEVTLVDISSKMLAEAVRNAEESGVATSMTFTRGDVAALPDLFSEPAFDMVLCHNLIQYVDDLDATIRAICHPLRASGIVSLMSVNRHSDLYRTAIREMDLAAAYAQLDTETTVARLFGLTVHRYAAEDMIGPLEAAGCAVVGQYGVRCVSDYILDNDRKTEPIFYEQLERLEHALTDRYPYNLLARFFQLIARKDGSLATGTPTATPPFADR